MHSHRSSIPGISCLERVGYDTFPDKMSIRYHLALGSNQGNRHKNLVTGLTLLGRWGHVAQLSSVYITHPVDMSPEGSNFFNMACVYESSLQPRRLLCLCKAIEARCGRIPDSHNQPRPLDIDILLAGSICMNTEALVIPHPRIEERPFVLKPLLEIEPNACSPLHHAPYRNSLLYRRSSGICGRFRLHDQGVAGNRLR